MTFRNYLNESDADKIIKKLLKDKNIISAKFNHNGNIDVETKTGVKSWERDSVGKIFTKLGLVLKHAYDGLAGLSYEMELNEPLAEASILTPEEFIKSVENNFHKHFPNGFIKVKHSNNLTEAITGTFGMIGNIKDNSQGYHENDRMRHAFVMFPLDKEATIWSFKSSMSWIYIKPDEGKNLAMDRILTKMGNNSKITLDKADIKLSKFFKKLSGIMSDNVDNIFDVEKIDKKYLIFK